MNFRQLHRKIAPILFLPLLLSALSGISYRIGRSWFGLSKDFGSLMMTIHEGRYLGKPLVPIYVLLTGVGLIGLIVTGARMLKLRKETDKSQLKFTKLNFRSLHRFLAPIFFVPLFVSASTGIVYRLGKAWFGLSPEQAKFFMNIHQGTYLGSSLRPVYILLVGLGMLGILITGIQMTGIFRSSVFKKST